MRILLSFVVVVMVYSCLTVSATNLPKHRWLPGKIQLKNGHTLSGQISYHLKHNILMYKAGSKIKTFTPRLVDYFEVHNNDLTCIKRYHAISVRVYENKMVSQFFQIVTSGGVSLLKREATVRRRVGKKTVVKKIDQFYYLDESQFVKSLVPSKKNLLKLMSAHADKVNAFIEKQNLKPNKAAHLTQLFIFYNELKDSSG
ncbi:hypothetical protein QQ020_28515 [Fulvivirgaceae bacterium BMA12]|uniref:Uncharacterized protein n=1 Tax=Agaribacillus aureus TaxID=3051825 RepID=A0ABT8LGB6_9BACT|nr:hypothetical protein [Fulvivirgaceae bacterium BMA12]